MSDADAAPKPLRICGVFARLETAEVYPIVCLGPQDEKDDEEDDFDDFDDEWDDEAMIHVARQKPELGVCLYRRDSPIHPSKIIRLGSCLMNFQKIYQWDEWRPLKK